jgi:glycosyltransferase involved in cell wall biosynthesis
MRRSESSRIRVLLTVPHLLPTASPYREMMAIAKYLPRDDFDLSVCVLRPAGLAEASPILKRYGVNSFVARFRPTAASAMGVAGALSDQRLLGAHGPIDLQHSLDFTSSPFEAICARLQGRRFMFTQRNLNEDGHWFLLKQKVRLSAGVLAISAHTHALVRSLIAAPERLSTISPGFDFADLQQPEWKPSPEPQVILAVGHLQRRKRLEDAIRTLPMVMKARPRTELWVVGRTYDTSYRQELGELSTTLGVADHVKFMGVRDDVIPLMQTASALYHCAESEAFGWSILEAMATGVPVVAYDSGGPGELIEHGVTGFLGKIGDYEACSRHLVALLSDRALAARISSAARAMATATYTAESFGQQHAVFYRQLVKLAATRDLIPNPQERARG